jgi:hypothetical protein
LNAIPSSQRKRVARAYLKVAAKRRRSRSVRSTAMLDVIMLTLGLGMFVLSIGYVYVCDRL